RVANDLEEPGAPVSAGKRPKVPQGPQRRVLHDIFRIVLVAHEPSCQPIRRIEMRKHDVVEAADRRPRRTLRFSVNHASHGFSSIAFSCCVTNSEPFLKMTCRSDSSRRNARPSASMNVTSARSSTRRAAGSRSDSDATRRSSSTHWPLRLPSSLSTTEPSASAGRILITLASRATKVPWPTADGSSRPICGRLNYLSLNKTLGSAWGAALIFRSSGRPRDLASWFRRRSALAEDAELPHPAAQRVWIEIEDSCGALRSLDDAVGVF